MRKIIFDIETRNTFDEAQSNDPADLDISVVCLYDSKDDKYYSFEQHEFKDMWKHFEQADMIIGYNSEHFDVPLLNKYYAGDLTKIKHLDILKEIKNSYGRRMKLDQVAEGTLGEHKSGHGLDAIVWWKKGELDKIKKYCIDDVRLTKDIYEYARKNGKLKFQEGPNVLEIKLDTKNWEKKEDATALTFSLPF
ncbi:MAG: ribonuclease H-like domain-containing protein [Candidatus Paceibacterota bacterium]|jgi:DEAD/DEAH box helicase domain-containing protein